MRHVQPPRCAVQRVSGISGAVPSHASASARSHGSHSLQSCHGTPSVCPSSSERKPEQSTNRSPATSAPDSSVSAATSPLSPSRATSTTWPSIRSEEHTSELQSIMRHSYAVFCLTTKQQHTSSTKY